MELIQAAWGSFTCSFTLTLSWPTGGHSSRSKSFLMMMSVTLPPYQPWQAASYQLELLKLVPSYQAIFDLYMISDSSKKIGLRYFFSLMMHYGENWILILQMMALVVWDGVMWCTVLSRRFSTAQTVCCKFLVQARITTTDVKITPLNLWAIKHTVCQVNTYSFCKFG